MILYMLSGVILLLIAGITLGGNSLEVTGQSDMEKAQDILSTAAIATANATMQLLYYEGVEIKKEQTSYSDLLDALRLALKGYTIE